MGKVTWSKRYCPKCGRKLQEHAHPDLPTSYYECRGGHLWKWVQETEQVREALFAIGDQDFYAFKPEAAHDDPQPKASSQ